MRRHHIRIFLIGKQEKLSLIPLTILILVIHACASSYHPISLGLLDYTDGDSVSGISFGYHFNALYDFRDTKYTDKEIQNNIKLVAFNITNLSGHSLDLVNDLDYFQNQSILIKPILPDSIYKSFELKSKKYLADLSLSVVNAYWWVRIGYGSNADWHFRFIPIGLFIGPLLTVYNIATVKKSNASFRRDLNRYSPFNCIDEGSNRFVLIPFKGINEQPIQIRLKKKY